MSKLNNVKAPIITPKAFVDLPSIPLYIEVGCNNKNQICKLYANYKGQEFDATIVSGDIERAWKLLEKFILKHHKTNAKTR